VPFEGFTDEYKLNIYHYICDSIVPIDSNVLIYYDMVNELLTHTSDVSIVNETVISIKFFAESDENLSPEQKQQVAVMLSIARYSNYFWAPRKIGGNGSGEDFLNSLNNNKHQMKRWQNIVGSDVLGGLAGGIGWYGAAVFGGPVGVGAFVGNIIWGAASGSLTAWALQ
jgi:hypothetical protein